MPTHRNPSSHDPHRVLGVPRDATPAQIRTAYRALLLALHPDTRAEPADPARLAQVVAAHAQLRDVCRRTTGDPAPSTANTPPEGGSPIPVRVRDPRRDRPDILVGPVRSHRSR
ncbi:J domain-containing protein [Lentzea sp. DG1S-22]|uniref:J domain-containing protein n=1 Tax=Lentzea sp. DG1S-22 TaxID=3108822 RepID=UPI002E785F13|nr:J domain-containing protein [Lentzea sp. DG1S-22]WVH82854.1 J domain-containing protein [Lentzea sp. DG1S-22]